MPLTGPDLQRRRLALGLTARALGDLLDEHGQQVEAWEQITGPLPAPVSRRVDWTLAIEEREHALAAAGHPPCPVAAAFHGTMKPGDIRAFRLAVKQANEHAQSCLACRARSAYIARLPPLPDPPVSPTLRAFAWVSGLIERLPLMLRPAAWGALLIGAMTVFRAVVLTAFSPRSLTPQVGLAVLEAIGIGAYGGAVGGIAYGIVRPRTRRFGRRGDYLTGVACAYAYLLAFFVPFAFFGDEPFLRDPFGILIIFVFGTLVGLFIGHSWFKDESDIEGGA